MTYFLKHAALLSLAALVAVLPATADSATTRTKAAAAATTDMAFTTFFKAFRQAVLDNDREAVADMLILPFRDFSASEPERSVTTRAAFLARYDLIFTPAVIAGIHDNHIRAFRPGIDDGDVPGPIVKGEYLLDLEDWSDQIVFSPKGKSYGMSRIPFYS